MNVVEAMQSDLADAHWLLEQVVDALHAETLHWLPPGTANTIAATYAHVIANEDHFVQEVLRRRPLLAESDWAGRSGINLPVPRRESDWFAWSRRVQMDLPSAQRYAAALGCAH